MRSLCNLFGIGLLLAVAGQSSADTLKLNGVAPAGTVYLYGSSLPSPYTDASHQVDCYAGILNWTDTTNSTSVYTYCIDVAAIINVGNSYSFQPLQSLDSSGATSSLGFSTAVVDGIYNLWANPTYSSVTTLGTGIPNDASHQELAAEFQVALWDIIYNGGSMSATNTALSFTNPANGFSSADLTEALNAAHAAYTAPVPTPVPDVQVLIATDGSQNQALYISGTTPGPTPVPLPASCTAGLALLGIVAVGTWRRRTTVLN